MTDAVTPKATASARADAAAWTAVAAGTLGALMATLDTSIVNASLPTIQGEIGATGTDGTWISTAYLVAEIVMIPMAGWLQRAMGLRTLLLIAVTLFTICSIYCGLSQSLGEMIIGRIGQGFSGGALIPTALSIVGTRLPRTQQSIGTALFGGTVVLGPVIGPVLGGYLTEHLSWHYVFFINLPLGIGLLVLLVLGLQAEKADTAEFRHTDVLGILGLILGLGCLTTLLEEGQLDLWFQSDFITTLAVISAFGFMLLILGQFVAKKPVIRLRLLVDRQFGGVVIMTLVVGAALYGVLYLIPQFLFAVPGYNAEQSGVIAALSGVPTLLLMVAFPFLVKRIDMRLAVGTGLFIYAISCFLDAHLTSDSAGGQFVDGQLLRGVGQFFSMLFLNQAATAAVAQEYATDASGLFNAARNLGGSLGLAAIATVQQQRLNLHFARLTESLPANRLNVQHAAHTLGITRLYDQLITQATVMTYNDLYLMLGGALLLAVPLALVLKSRPPPSVAP